MEVTLGSVTVPVVPQKHAYLRERLGPAFRAAFDGAENLTVDHVLEWAGDGVYTILCALIPALPSRMPAFVFAGYHSAEAQAAGEYDPALDESPSIPEIRNAVTLALKVNGIDELMSLGKGLIDPRLFRAILNQKLAEIADSPTPSTGSPTSPSLSGESDSTSSSTTHPTSTENSDSPSPASTDS